MLAALCAAAVVLLAGCGGSSSIGGEGKKRVDVFAAASLETPFREYAKSLTSVEPNYSFGGSGTQAQQIEKGLKPDVYASANPRLPAYLHEKGLVEEPVVFAGNKLVVAVPKNSPLASLADLEKRGIRLSIGTDAATVGPAARQVLARLPLAQRRLIVPNVRDEEPSVKAMVAKLTSGGADAAFLFQTDVKAAGELLRAIELPASVQVPVKYEIAVVKGAEHPKQAEEFVKGLLSGAGAAALAHAGFLPPSAAAG